MANALILLAKRYIQFKEEPSDLVATRNKPAELRCIVAATNNATISWTRNGVKVDVINDTRRRILPRGSLYFTTIIRRKKLSPDAGVYRCIGETEVNGRSFKIISREARLSIAGKVINSYNSSIYLVMMTHKQ